MLYIKDNGKGIRKGKLTELIRFTNTPTLQVETKKSAKLSLNKVVQASTIDEATMQTIQQCFQILEVHAFVSVYITVSETDIKQAVPDFNLDDLKRFNIYILQKSAHSDRKIIAARAVGVKSIDQLLNAPLESVTYEAEKLGINKGIIGKDALLKMI